MPVSHMIIVEISSFTANSIKNFLTKGDTLLLWCLAVCLLLLLWKFRLCIPNGSQSNLLCLCFDIDNTILGKDAGIIQVSLVQN